MGQPPLKSVPAFAAFHVAPDSPQMETDFLRVVASLMAKSRHPLAGDILRVARANAVLPVSVEGFEDFPDRGLGGLVKLPEEQRPRAVVLGTREFIRECGLDIPGLLEAAARRWENESGSSILLGGWDAWVRGILKFHSTV
jgi:cation transport ATPase